MTFEEALAALLQRALPFEELEAAVRELHREYGREVPPPITGTVAGIEPADDFG